MNNANLRLIVSASILAAACFMASGAGAQNVRTWVSNTGNDANPCTLPAPCKTFAGALAKTDAGGEISVLDSGDYGAVTIAKAITINAHGSLARILVSSGDGILVNAGPTDQVYLRGLDLNGAGVGLFGVRFVSGNVLHVEDTHIYNFLGDGINFAPGAPSAQSDLYVANVTVRNNVEGAVHVAPAATSIARVTLNDVQMVGNRHGLRIEDGTVALVRNSTVSGSAFAGFNAVSIARPVSLTLDGITSTDNVSGVRSSGPFSTLRLNKSTVIGNSGTGLSAVYGGKIISFGNNEVSSNGGGSGAPTSTEAPM